MERMMGSIVRQAVEGGGDEINSISCDINMMVANWGEMHPQKVVGFQPLPHTWPPEYCCNIARSIGYSMCLIYYLLLLCVQAGMRMFFCMFRAGTENNSLPPEINRKTF